MTIRKRIWISHILLFIVPVITAILIFLIAAGSLFLFARQGNHIYVESHTQFLRVSETTIYSTQYLLGKSASPEQLTLLYSLIDPEDNYIAVTQDGTLYEQYGNAELKHFLPLPAVTAGIARPVSHSADGIHYIVSPRSQAGHRYLISMVSREAPHNSDEAIETFALAVLILILLTILLCYMFTSRFITLFLHRKLLNPLTELQQGVKALEQGNLDIRLTHTDDDEFKPIINQFNSLVAALARSLNDRARQEEDRKQMIAGLSHDIRSPLTSIKAYVEGLKDGVAKTPAMEEKYLSIIQRKTDEVDTLLNQLLLYSKLDMGRESLHLETVWLPDFLPRFLADNQALYEAKGLTVTGSYANAAITADTMLLRRVFSNILDNSAKYRGTTGTNCHITARAENGQVTISFADNGPGVPPEALPQLFTPFYRTDSARSNPHEGSGLGLAVTARAAELLQGHITAANASPHGLIITIVLPEAEL